MHRFLPFIALAFLLPGCAAQVAQHDDQTCQSYGVVPGSSAYFDCRQHIADQRQQMAVQFMQNYHFQPYYLPPPTPLPAPNPSVNCMTSYIGSQAYTQCH